MKNDHRSQFSNLSNWKEEAWKNQGFNGIRTRDLRDTGAISALPTELWSLYSPQLAQLSIPAAGQKDRRLWGREWDTEERTSVKRAVPGDASLIRAL